MVHEGEFKFEITCLALFMQGSETTTTKARKPTLSILLIAAAAAAVAADSCPVSSRRSRCLPLRLQSRPRSDLSCGDQSSATLGMISGRHGYFYLRRGTSTQIYRSILSFLPSVKRLQEAYRGQRSTGSWVVEATDFRIEVRRDLRGHWQPQTHGAHQGQKGDRFGILEFSPPKREGGNEKV